MMTHADVIIAPVLTEKSTMLKENLLVYTLKVDARANKKQVADALKNLFNVDVVSCKILNIQGYKKTVGTKSGHRRGQGRTSSWKKAYVKLAEGQKIEILEA